MQLSSSSRFYFAQFRAFSGILRPSAHHNNQQYGVAKLQFARPQAALFSTTTATESKYVKWDGNVAVSVLDEDLPAPPYTKVRYVRGECVGVHFVASKICYTKSVLLYNCLSLTLIVMFAFL